MRRSLRILPLSRRSPGGERNDHFLSLTPSHIFRAMREPVMRPCILLSTMNLYSRQSSNRAKGRMIHENPRHLT